MTSRKIRKCKVSGGKGGILERALYLDNSNTAGAGGYGLVIKPKSKNEVFKLFYDLSTCTKMAEEAEIQQNAYLLFKKYLPEVGVPKVTYFKQNTIKFADNNYLCGIGMKYISPPNGYDEAVHIILGYEDDDIDTSWGRTVSSSVSLTNPTRGFFASKDTLETIWSNEQSDMTVEKMAYLMGKSMRLFIDNGIIPMDLEFIWSSKPYIIDFGLCELGAIEPLKFFEMGGTHGLSTDIYVPHKGQEGYDSFKMGYFD
jgi:hypothetical protein